MFSGGSSGQPMKLDTLVLNIGSGSMEIENIVATHLKHKSSSGKVAMNSVTAQTGALQVSSGSVKVQNYSGKLDAHVSSGKLQIELDEIGRAHV